MISVRDKAVAAATIDTFVDWENGDVVKAEGWQKHTIVKMDGESEHPYSAQFRLLSAPWGHTNFQMPSMVYMPEKNRLFMIAESGSRPVRTIYTYSDDGGETWSPQQSLQDGKGNKLDIGMSVGLTYMGEGRLALGEEFDEANKPHRQFSDDYGETWTRSALMDFQERPLYYWDPMLVDRDESGKITRLLEGRYWHTGREWDSGTGPYSQGCIWHSEDLGLTWSKEVKVPQWLGVNEVALIRAKNGDIVAACRTDNEERFIGQLDWYSGLAISISKDNGETWSELNRLYEFGRHHQSLVMMPNGDILMTYAVRQGYEDTPEGYGQFGIEAMISKDNGQTWDIDGRTILATWRGKILGGENAWWGLGQSTTTALLPDGSLITVFGTGMRNRNEQEWCIMDLGAVKWRLKEN